MSQIASRAAGLVAAPLSLPADLVADNAAAATITQAAIPAPPEDPSATAAPAAAGLAATADATASIASGTASTTAPDAAAPAVTSSSVAAGAITAPDVTAANAFAKPAPATTAQVGTPTTFAPPPSTTGGIGGAVAALIVVIALILALAWLAKRMPVLGGGAGSNPALRLVGSLALGPRERLVVVAVGDTQLLLGVGAGGTRTLHTLSQPLPLAAATTPAFAQLLAQHFGKKA